MARGGYRKPQGGPAVSGPGKFSKRTDGQAKRVEGLDNPDVNYGDRQMLEAGQAAAPVRGAAGAPVRRMQGEAVRGGRLPSFMFGMDSANPLEPATAGLDMGQGPGSEILEASQAPDDIREVVLDYLATTFQNHVAADHLHRIREEKAGPAATTPTPVPTGRAMESTALEEQPVEGLA